MMRRLTADDFLTGLLAGLAIRGWKAISIRSDRFDRALSTTFTKLKELASDESLNVSFRIRPHPFHGDSTTVREAISNAAQRDLVSLDNPEFQDLRLKLSQEEAEEKFASLPAGRDFFLQLTDEFLDRYREGI